MGPLGTKRRVRLSRSPLVALACTVPKTRRLFYNGPTHTVALRSLDAFPREVCLPCEKLEVACGGETARLSQDSKAPTASGSGLLRHAQQQHCREVLEVLPRGLMPMPTDSAWTRVISRPSLVPPL